MQRHFHLLWKACQSLVDTENNLKAVLKRTRPTGPYPKEPAIPRLSAPESQGVISSAPSLHTKRTTLSKCTTCSEFAMHSDLRSLCRRHFPELYMHLRSFNLEKAPGRSNLGSIKKSTGWQVTIYRPYGKCYPPITYCYRINFPSVSLWNPNMNSTL